MRFSLLSVAAGLAGASSAFLLPPEISSSDIDIIKTLPFEDAVARDGRIMEINCPGCPVATSIESKMHAVNSVLKLNFTLAQQNDFDYLLLNGLQIYPIDPRSETFMEPLTATQMIQTQDKTWEVAATPKLGYSLSIRHPVAYSEKDHLDLVSIHLEIVEVADKFMTGLPSVEIKLLETPSGKLMIGDAEITTPKSLSSAPTGNAQECTDLLCKWRAIVAAKLAQLKAGVKGCGSNKSRPHARPASDVTHPKHYGHYGGHGEHGHDRPHQSSGPHRSFRHHRHRHGRVTRFLRGIVLHIFIPVLIGIMVGITASLIGMVVGHIVIFIWRLFFRRSTSSYQTIQQEEAADPEVKNMLEGPPPQYEEAGVGEKTAE